MSSIEAGSWGGALEPIAKAAVEASPRLADLPARSPKGRRPIEAVLNQQAEYLEVLRVEIENLRDRLTPCLDPNPGPENPGGLPVSEGGSSMYGIISHHCGKIAQCIEIIQGMARSLEV